MLRLVSHPLCPYVQRAAIVAAEKRMELERVTVDLADRPDWFVAASPTGKVPLLIVGDTVLFESAAIAEYLDEVGGRPLLRSEPIARAKTRAWVQFASDTLAAIGTLYSAADEAAFDAAVSALNTRFERLESEIVGPWFEGERFGLADAAFAPVFRYLDSFERLADLELARDLEAIAAWRKRLAGRPSVTTASPPDYHKRLEAFLRARGSWLSQRIASR